PLHAHLRAVREECIRLRRGVCRSEPCDRHAARRTADVIQAGLVEALDRTPLASLLAADADLEVTASPAALPGRHLHELADALGVEYLERIVLEQAGLEVLRQECRGVVARDAERRLREVVRAEREEVRLL